jgi:peptidoglycan/LPS O-acetylase OafA/YrhL
MADKISSAGRFRVPSLDGLRALSILLVLFHHGLPHDSSYPVLSHWLQVILGNGSLGVSIFFVISGYLITMLLVREWQADGQISIGRFYARRALRIFPVFYCYIGVVLLLRARGLIDVSRGDLLLASFYAWNYSLGTGRSWYLSHFWSLSLEEQFYLLWPLTILLCKPRAAAKVALALILLSPFIRVADYYFWPASRGQIGMMLHTSADKLMFGCLAALWQASPRWQRLLRRTDRLGLPALSALFLFFVSPVLTDLFRGAYALPLGVSLEGAAITCLMLWLVRRPDSLVGRVFNSTVMSHLGTISYSLYIWQQLFFGPSGGVWQQHFPMNVLCCFFAAEFSYWCLERPVLRLKPHIESLFPNRRAGSGSQVVLSCPSPAGKT